jgi:hypothetical protein
MPGRANSSTTPFTTFLTVVCAQGINERSSALGMQTMCLDLVRIQNTPKVDAGAGIEPAASAL